VQKVRGNIYVETGFHGCNVSFIATGDGVVLIDTPQVPSEARKWKKEIERFGPIRFVINNEPHSDHITGDFFFDGLLVAHEGAAEAMQKTQVSMIEDMLKRIAPESLPLPAGYLIRVPDITFSQNMTIRLGGLTFNLLLMPGHTPFQVATYIPEEKIIFTSDNVVTGGQPFLHQAVPYQWLDSLRKIGDMDVETIVPGHGPLCDKSYLNQMENTIKTWIKMVEDAMDRGLSSAEAQDSIRFKDYFPDAPDDEFLRPMRRMMIAHLYEELTKNRRKQSG